MQCSHLGWLSKASSASLADENTFPCIGQPLPARKGLHSDLSLNRSKPHGWNTDCKNLSASSLQREYQHLKPPRSDRWETLLGWGSKHTSNSNHLSNLTYLGGSSKHPYTSGEEHFEETRLVLMSTHTHTPSKAHLVQVVWAASPASPA